MLSSPKESPEVRLTPESEGSSPFSSFLKVVDSIQGLNHLVQEISLEKILDADKKAKQLIRHLDLLQKDLTKLREIKHSLSKGEQSGANEAHESSLDTTLKTANDSELVRSKEAPKNLIPFPTPPRISKSRKEPSPLQSTPSFTTPVKTEPAKTEEKQDQKRDSDGGAAFCLGKPLDIKTLSSSHYIPSNLRKKEEEPESSDFTTQPLKTNIAFDGQSFRSRHKDSAKPYEIIQSRFKNEGDLDRRLKTIVRDYGEVDIYSYRHKDNMRKKALIVTLLLVLGYFASSLFFPLNHKEMSAIPLRLEPSVTTERANVPEARKSINPNRPANQADAAASSTETKPTNESGGNDLDL